MKTWQERADESIAQGCLTYSKRPAAFIEGVYGTHCTGGHGSRITIDKKDYIDYMGACGANILGVDNAFSLPTTDEVILAEAIKQRIPCIDKLKFLKTGSEACLAAVRIARTFTNRDLVLGTGYHGWGQGFINAETPGAGTVFEFYQKFPNMEALADNLEAFIVVNSTLPAAVIVEPIQLDLDTKPQLLRIRELCDKCGAVLIYDEVITGFRVPKFTVANWYGIRPDIICLGKAIASGAPLSVVGGKKEIMDAQGYFVSSTFAGEQNSLRNAIQVLSIINEDKLNTLWQDGGNVHEAFNKISPKVQIVGYNTRGEFQGKDEDVALFWQEMYRRGIFLGRAWFYSFAHTQHDNSEFLKTAKVVLEGIENNRFELVGKLPRPVFKRN